MAWSVGWPLLVDGAQDPLPVGLPLALEFRDPLRELRMELGVANGRRGSLARSRMMICVGRLGRAALAGSGGIGRLDALSSFRAIVTRVFWLSGVPHRPLNAVGAILLGQSRSLRQAALAGHSISW